MLQNLIKTFNQKIIVKLSYLLLKNEYITAHFYSSNKILFYRSNNYSTAQIIMSPNKPKPMWPIQKAKTCQSDTYTMPDVLKTTKFQLTFVKIN
jgi:hypothetical protein